jgi:allene oxide cyclase
MKKFVALLAALALVAAVPVITATASSGGGHHGKTISVIEHPISDATTDTGPAGDSVGDILTFANPVFDRNDAKEVGSDQGFCIRVRAGVSYECTWTNFLKGGQIVVQGPFFDTQSSKLAITGGTGRYAHASGTMRLEAIENGTEFKFVFHLR